jgi:hypothetical protein
LPSSRPSGNNANQSIGGKDPADAITKEWEKLQADSDSNRKMSAYEKTLQYPTVYTETDSEPAWGTSNNRKRNVPPLPASNGTAYDATLVEFDNNSVVKVMRYTRSDIMKRTVPSNTAVLLYMQPSRELLSKTVKSGLLPDGLVIPGEFDNGTNSLFAGSTASRNMFGNHSKFMHLLESTDGILINTAWQHVIDAMQQHSDVKSTMFGLFCLYPMDVAIATAPFTNDIQPVYRYGLEVDNAHNNDAIPSDGIAPAVRSRQPTANIDVGLLQDRYTAWKRVLIEQITNDFHWAEYEKIVEQTSTPAKFAASTLQSLMNLKEHVDFNRLKTRVRDYYFPDKYSVTLSGDIDKELKINNHRAVAFFMNSIPVKDYMDIHYPGIFEKEDHSVHSPFSGGSSGVAPTDYQQEYFQRRLQADVHTFVLQLGKLVSPLFITTTDDNPLHRTRTVGSEKYASGDTILRELRAGLRPVKTSMLPKPGFARIDLPVGLHLKSENSWGEIQILSDMSIEGIAETNILDDVVSCAYSEHILELMDSDPGEVSANLSESMVSLNMMFDTGEVKVANAVVAAAVPDDAIADACFTLLPYDGTDAPDASYYVDTLRGDWMVGISPTLLTCGAALATTQAILSNESEASKISFTAYDTDYDQSDRLASLQLNILNQHRVLFGLQDDGRTHGISYDTFREFIRTALKAQNRFPNVNKRISTAFVREGGFTRINA